MEEKGKQHLISLTRKGKKKRVYEVLNDGLINPDFKRKKSSNSAYRHIGDTKWTSVSFFP